MRLPLWLLKFRARRLYYGYQAELDLYSCGIQLAEEFSPRLAGMGRRLDDLVEEIKERSQSGPATKGDQLG